MKYILYSCSTCPLYSLRQWQLTKGQPWWSSSQHMILWCVNIFCVKSGLVVKVKGIHSMRTWVQKFVLYCVWQLLLDPLWWTETKHGLTSVRVDVPVTEVWMSSASWPPCPVCSYSVQPFTTNMMKFFRLMLLCGVVDALPGGRWRFNCCR